jgi:epsilon-lactone hydrolase
VRVLESIESAALLYLHGGRYTMGSTKAYRGFRCAARQRGGQTRALSIDYRLAPEHPYPAAIDDIVKSYKWLLAQHVDPARVIIAGDSAGGGLTLATLLELREKGITLPAAAVCLSPSTDLAQTGESITSKAADDIFLTSSLLDFCYGNFLGPDGDPTNPFVSPLYADLTGLPPLLVMVGTAEILLEDSIRLAAKAEAAGVDVDLVIGEEMFHVWRFLPLRTTEISAQRKDRTHD